MGDRTYGGPTIYLSQSQAQRLVRWGVPWVMSLCILLKTCFSIGVWACVYSLAPRIAMCDYLVQLNLARPADDPHRWGRVSWINPWPFEQTYNRDLQHVRASTPYPNSAQDLDMLELYSGSCMMTKSFRSCLGRRACLNLFRFHIDVVGQAHPEQQRPSLSCRASAQRAYWPAWSKYPTL